MAEPQVLCLKQTNGGTNKWKGGKKSMVDLYCPWITRWLFSLHYPPVISPNNSVPKSLLGLDPTLLLRKGLVLSEHSLFLPSIFSSLGGGRTQAHCSLADGSWSYYGNSSNPSIYHFSSYCWSIECYLLSLSNCSNSLWISYYFICQKTTWWINRNLRNNDVPRATMSFLLRPAPRITIMSPLLRITL